MKFVFLWLVCCYCCFFVAQAQVGQELDEMLQEVEEEYADLKQTKVGDGCQSPEYQEKLNTLFYKAMDGYALLILEYSKLDDPPIEKMKEMAFKLIDSGGHLSTLHLAAIFPIPWNRAEFQEVVQRILAAPHEEEDPTKGEKKRASPHNKQEKVILL